MSYHSIIEAERDLAALIERAAAGKRNRRRRVRPARRPGFVATEEAPSGEEVLAGRRSCRCRRDVAERLIEARPGRSPVSFFHLTRPASAPLSWVAPGMEIRGREGGGTEKQGAECEKSRRRYCLRAWGLGFFVFFFEREGKAL